MIVRIIIMMMMMMMMSLLILSTDDGNWIYVIMMKLLYKNIRWKI